MLVMNINMNIPRIPIPWQNLLYYTIPQISSHILTQNLFLLIQKELLEIKKSHNLTQIVYMKIIKGQNYVITCNHIMVKHATYTGYCCCYIDSQIKTIKFDMVVHHRIPEIDVVIMKILKVYLFDNQTHTDSNIILQELTIN